MQEKLHYMHLDENYFDQNMLEKMGKSFDSIHIGLLRGDCLVRVVDMDGWSHDKLKHFNRSLKQTVGEFPYIIKNALDNKRPNLRPYSWYTEEDCLKSALVMSGSEVKLSNHNYLYHLVHHEALPLIELALYKAIPEITSVKNSGSFIYPPDEGMMSWHTNESLSPTPVRVYFVYSPEDRKSYFRYIGVDGRVYTSWDRKGWNIRAFHCGSLQVDGYRLWHCVMSNTHRFSFGFRLTGIVMDQLGFMAKEFDAGYMNIEGWRAW
ncbi:hypothetical protein ACN3E9_08750 [Vibrio pectenicida]|uniref:hypothetical protein n=1 Tax=Vibrio pectenicida TaxID=62763 RepID=UPI003B996716